MRFLIDNALSPLVAQALRKERAAAESRVLVSADTDFGALLALSELAGPSIILFRRESGRSPQAQVELLLANLNAVKAAADEGSIIVFDENRIRIRRLPISDQS